MGVFDAIDPFKRAKSLLGGPDPGKAQLKQVQALQKQAKSENQGYFGQALGANREALATTRGGYANAKREIGRIGRQSRLDVMDQGTLNQGIATQNAITGGSLGSTVYTNLARGIQSDTSRALARLDESIATLFANNEIAGATAESNVLQNRAGIYQNQAATNTNLTTNQASTIASVQHENPNAWVQSLFQIGGTALGAQAGGQVR